MGSHTAWEIIDSLIKYSQLTYSKFSLMNLNINTCVPFLQDNMLVYTLCAWSTQSFELIPLTRMHSYSKSRNLATPISSEYGIQYPTADTGQSSTNHRRMFMYLRNVPAIKVVSPYMGINTDQQHQNLHTIQLTDQLLLKISFYKVEWHSGAKVIPRHQTSHGQSVTTKPGIPLLNIRFENMIWRKQLTR